MWRASGEVNFNQKIGRTDCNAAAALSLDIRCAGAAPRAPGTQPHLRNKYAPATTPIAPTTAAIVARSAPAPLPAGALTSSGMPSLSASVASAGSSLAPGPMPVAYAYLIAPGIAFVRFNGFYGQPKTLEDFKDQLEDQGRVPRDQTEYLNEQL